MPLAMVEAGRKVRVAAVTGAEETRKRLGAEDYDLCVLSYGGSMGAERVNDEILAVMIALNADLAKRLMVEPL